MIIMIHLILLHLLHLSQPKHFLVETEGEHPSQPKHFLIETESGTETPGGSLTGSWVPHPLHSLESLKDNFPEEIDSEEADMPDHPIKGRGREKKKRRRKCSHSKKGKTWTKCQAREWGINSKEFYEGEPCKDKGRECKEECSKEKKYVCKEYCSKEKCEGDPNCISWQKRQKMSGKKDKQTRAQIRGRLNCRLIVAQNGNIGRYCRLKNCGGSKTRGYKYYGCYKSKAKSDYNWIEEYFDDKGKDTREVNNEYCKLTDDCKKCHF